MRTTSSFSFYCRSSKKDRNGYAPLEVSISICGTRKFLNLPMKFRPQDFNKKKPSSEILEALDLWRVKINGYMLDMMKQGMVVTASTLREIIQSGGVRAYTAQRLFNDYLLLLKKRVNVNLSPSVYRKYELVAEKALKFIGNDTDVSAITPAVIKNIEVSWRANYDPATMVGLITKLKTFIRYGMDNGKILTNPFQGIKIARPNKPILALKESEVEYLLTLNLDSRLQRTLDTFLVQCATGMAYADLLSFKFEDMKCFEGHYYISKKRAKTGKVFTALVLPFGVDIIKHYRGVPRVPSNQVYNRFLKEINPTYTSHLGRRTFASILANKNAPMSVVAAALGDDVQTAVRYYAKVLDSTVIKQQISVLKE